ncbi:hypothetical protein D3C81_2141020 [compost metagenome]
MLWPGADAGASCAVELRVTIGWGTEGERHPRWVAGRELIALGEKHNPVWELAKPAI